MRPVLRRDFWEDLGGACLIAAAAAAPIVSFMAIERGFEVGKIAFAYPLVALALASLLVAGVWRPPGRFSFEERFVSLVLMVFLLLAAASSLTADNLGLALLGGYYRREGLVTWSVYAAFFYAVMTWARRRQRIDDFLDVLLLASTIPITYAVLQRLDLDFAIISGRDLTRPGSTLGNPVFLAAYLALLMPLGIVRCWQSRHRPPELALWLTVTLLQIAGLAITQTRGPLLALVPGMLLLASLAAARARALSLFAAVAAASLAAIILLTAVNTVPAARLWAQDKPVVGRLVFIPDTSASTPAAIASRSAQSRLGMWQAGADTFAASSLGQKLLGHGPESAPSSYFPHMPATVMRMDGYDTAHTFDRLHADTFDIGLNFGLLGWIVYCVFFASVVYISLRTLFGLSGRLSLILFGITVVASGSLAALFATLVGLASAAVPAFGVGVGAGWLVFAFACAWRRVRRKQGTPSTGNDGLLLAGLTSALLVFWLDAQVNIPVLTTRLISFATAALILALTIRPKGLDHAGVEHSRDGPTLLIWGVAFTLIAACSSFLPVVVYQGGAGQRWWLRLAPLVVFVLIAAWRGWADISRGRPRSGKGSAASWLAIVLGLPAAYAAIHFASMVTPDAVLGTGQILKIALALSAGPLFLVAACVIAALCSVRASTMDGLVMPVAALARLYAAIPFAFAVGATIPAWDATRAEVASALARRISNAHPQLAEQFAEVAIRVMPHEPYYQRQLIFDLLSHAIADIRTLGSSPERYVKIDRNLALAELQARKTLAWFPHDAWSPVALANVLQVRGLQVLRPQAPIAGANAAAEANELFLRAHRMFPAQPLLLRNWSQLLFDQGNPQDAFRLLDLMEKLIPNEIDAYAERIEMATQLADFKMVSDTLQRAQSRLDRARYRHLLRVATKQQ